MIDEMENGETTNSATSDFLDSYKSNSNEKEAKRRRSKFCGRYSMASAIGADGKKTIRRVFCGTYGCPICGKRKKYLVQRSIEEAMRKHELRVFATLTLKPGSCSPEDSARHIKKLWNKHRTYQRREFGTAPSFISIVEFQRNGNAHLHVLFSRYVPWKWLRRTWQAVGGGIIDVRSADENAPRYLAKYLSKAVNKAKVGNFRRVCCSRNIKLREAPRGEAYKFSKEGYYFQKLVNKGRIESELYFGAELEKGFVLAPATDEVAA